MSSLRNRLFSYSCALCRTTANTQRLSFQSLPHSFCRDGVCPRSSHSGTHPPPSIQLSFQQLTQYPFCKSFCLIYIHLMGGCTPLAGSTPHCKTRSMSAESTSTAADRAIRSRDSTTRKVFFFRTRFPSTPASGPLLMRTRDPTLK